MKILVFGATGSAGGSVLRVCLDSPAVEEVRAITRRPLKLAHDKLRVFIHADYLDYAPVEEAFAGVDACLYCLGISATQVPGESEYRTIYPRFRDGGCEDAESPQPRRGVSLPQRPGSRAEQPLHVGARERRRPSAT